MKVNGILSNELTVNTISPLGCVMSLSLFILYTNYCTSNVSTVHVLGLIKDDKMSSELPSLLLKIIVVLNARKTT